MAEGVGPAPAGNHAVVTPGDRRLGARRQIVRRQEFGRRRGYQARHKNRRSYQPRRQRHDRRMAVLDRRQPDASRTPE